jgi:ornithine decarboxylase
MSTSTSIDLSADEPFGAAFVAEEHFGHETPYLLMDLDAVEQRFTDLRVGLNGVAIHYAVKCNPDPSVLRRLADCGCAFEIASRAELDILDGLGIDPRSVLFSNPVKRIQDIRSAHDLGLWRYSFDSAEELRKIAQTAPGSAVYVRLTTSPHSSSVRSEGKFGIDEREAVALLRSARDMGLQPFGITFHVGSQMTNPQAWTLPIQQCAEIMHVLQRDGIHLSMVDVGGGFPVAYDMPVPPFALFGEVIALTTKLFPYPVEIVAEPGRAMVAESGVLVATVIGTARRHGQKWVHLDVGAFNGMMESLETANAMRFPVRDSLNSTEKEVCHLTGPSCDAQDTILYDVALSRDLSTGDRVFLGNAGSYTTSYASRFNGFDVPATYCVGRRRN